MQKHLSVKNQSVESSGITKDFREAICEYIWNGFEAGATKVEVTYTLNSLDGIDTITIIDNGKGIEFESLEDTFGAFLASQKNSLSVSVKSKDNKGKGRFNCFAANAEWITTYKKDNTFFRYTISLSGEQKDVYEFTPLEKSSVNQSGTIVNIFNVLLIFLT